MARSLGLLTVLSLVSFGRAQARLKLTYQRTKVGEEDKPSTSIITVDGGRIRMEGLSAGRRAPAGAMIVDGPAKKMLMIDSERKVYREITEADAKTMRERLAGQRARMMEHLQE